MLVCYNTSAMPMIQQTAILALTPKYKSSACSVSQVPQYSTYTITERVSQPNLNQTGTTKWAMNNIVNVVRPPHGQTMKAPVTFSRLLYSREPASAVTATCKSLHTI